MTETTRRTVVTDDARTTDVGSLSHIAADLRPLAVPVSVLRSAPDNARRHADRDVDALAASLTAHGQQKPIVAKRSYRGQQDIVICGNGTLAAARRLGWAFLAVNWFDGTDDEARQFAVRDNRTAELSEWDPSALNSLEADGVDLLSLWSDDGALADLLGADAPTPTFEPVSAEHRLDQLQAHCRTCTCRRTVAP